MYLLSQQNPVDNSTLYWSVILDKYSIIMIMIMIMIMIVTVIVIVIVNVIVVVIVNYWALHQSELDI